VRGLSLTDTRYVRSLTADCEAAACLVTEQSRLRLAEKRYSTARKVLSQACLAADLNFDVRTLSGDPFELLPQESRFHDLVVAFAADQRDASAVYEDEPALSERELIDLALRGVQPLLVVRRRPQPLERVLLIYDGTPESGRALRSYVSQSLTPDAEHRLLAIGESERSAREALQQMTEYFRRRSVALETGWICGRPRKVLVPYAEKWNADLLVMGVTRTNQLLRRLLGETAQDALRRLSSALYLAA
jgi:nucleotide-binding universal stress UspA family protein